YVADSFVVVAKLLENVAESGAKLLNSTYVDDIIYKNDRVSGVVVNWFPITQMPNFITCMDPIALESKIVIDATGHEADIAKKVADVIGIEKEKMGPKAMNVTEAEKLVVENTKQIHPGLVICGMASASFFNLPRMGPIFGGMLLSGKKAAEITLELIEKKVLV
ncbi:MAG: hypothetical protein V3T58_05015, partial [Candidatus Hydrothermarchaeales archaeon]